MRTSRAPRRFRAAALDLLPLAAWACLAGVVGGVLTLADAVPTTPAGRDALAFATLVLPVTVTYALQEGGRSAATWGKRRLGLRVVHTAGGRASVTRCAVRNAAKFAPWQAAHTAVFHLAAGGSSPWWLVSSIGAQVVALVSLLAMVLDREGRALHDRVARTRVVTTGHDHEGRAGFEQ